MNLGFFGRKVLIFAVVILFVLTAVSCGRKDNLPSLSGTINSGSSNPNESADSGWLDTSNSAHREGFSLIPALADRGVPVSLDLAVYETESEIKVEIINSGDSFSGMMCRLTPDNPDMCFNRAEWSEAVLREDSIRLYAPYENAVDVGMLRPGLASFDQVRPGDTVFTAYFRILCESDVEHKVSRAPTGDANIVSHLDISVDLDGMAHVSWEERNVGDYDNDGEVGVPDITPIAQNFGVSEGEILDRVDGSGDGEIGVPDITPIAENYGALLVGYNVYRIEEINGSFTPTIKLPNNDNITSIASADRPPPPISTLFAQYEYIDHYPPVGRRYLYGVCAFDGVFEEGESSFPLATYSFNVESALDWNENQVVSSPFGHAVSVPAGGVPDGTIIELREVPASEVNAVPSGGDQYINGIQVSAYDEGGSPVEFTGDVQITIPIPLGITSIEVEGGGAGAKQVSAVDAPEMLQVYEYDSVSQSLAEASPGLLDEEASGYDVTISATGIFCLFGAAVIDVDPPVWSSTVGVTSATVVGDNLVDVSFGNAEDISDPVSFNVYFSTSTPVDISNAEMIGGFTESPARIDAVRGAADYYFVVRAQDSIGNEEDNTEEAHVFVPRPNDSLFLATDKDEYEVGEIIYMTANVKAVAGKVYQLPAVRVTFTPLVVPAAGSVTLGSFFDYHDGLFFPAPIIPIEGNPSFIEFNVSFAQATKEAPAGSSGDLFEFKFKAYKPGNVKLGIPVNPPPNNPYSFYTSAANKDPQRFSWHQGYTIKIVPEGTLTQPSTE
ncbi:hypothetical protein J7K50_04165 [bacterium]|nr:hypothetical protein [bacterium]